MPDERRGRVDAWGQPADDSLEVHADAVAMLDALEELDADDLSPWELDFLSSVREAVDEGWVSDRQAEKGRQVHEERSRDGKTYRRKGKSK